MKKILISAGHSDTDPGATYQGITESSIAVEMRDMIASFINNPDIQVITDGAKGKNLPLQDAIRLAKQCHLSVEIHCNAATSQLATGVECISLPDRKPLAQRLSACVSACMFSKLRGDGGYIDQSQSQHARLGFVQEGKGLILEMFFLSNPAQLKTYQDMKKRMASVIAKVLQSAV